jgi:hypothetical protein
MHCTALHCSWRGGDCGRAGVRMKQEQQGCCGLIFACARMCPSPFAHAAATSALLWQHMPPAVGATPLLLLLLICAAACSAADILECGMVSIWNADGFADCEAASAAWSQRARLRRQSFREENRPKVWTPHSACRTPPSLPRHHQPKTPLLPHHQRNDRFCARTRHGTALATRSAAATASLSRQARSSPRATAFGAGRATTAARRSPPRRRGRSCTWHTARRSPSALWRCRYRARGDAAGRYGQYLESALQALHENYVNTWPAAVRVFCSVS